MKSLFATCACCLVMVVPATAANIAWLSLHPTDAAMGDAVTQGFTSSPDQGYVDLLRGNGHTVTRFASQSPNADYAANLNTFDLVMISRQVDSSAYDTDAERALWHGISKPMIFMSAYILRNNRLQFFTADDVPDINNQGPVTLTAAQPAHAIFQGVTLDGSNSMQYATYPISTPSGTVQRGISINTNPIRGGTVLATSGTAGSGSGGTLIGHWPAGTQLGTFTLAGPRLSFLSGTRESGGTGFGIPVAGIKDLTPAGDALFSNAVCFMSFCGPPPVPGDTDGDGVVEFADFEPIRANFRKSVASRSDGDLVTNGVVDFADFRQWKTAFTGGGGSLAGVDLGFTASVPEPGAAALVILAFGTLGILARRRAPRCCVKRWSTSDENG